MTVTPDVEPVELEGPTDALGEQEWMPEFMKKALNRDEIPVIQYDGQLKEEVLNACIQSEHIGATYIRLGPEKNILICLTTEDKIYVINMMLTHDVEFLSELLQQDLKIYMLGGQYVADRIYSEFELKLISTLDLNTFDIFLSLRKVYLNGLSRNSDRVSLSLVERCNLRFRNRVELQKYWLQIDLPERDSKREKEETNAIRQDVGSIQAKNVIRFRSFATRALAMAMNDRFEAIQSQDADNLYSFAIEIGSEDYVEYTNRTDKDCYSTVMHFVNSRRREVDV